MDLKNVRRPAWFLVLVLCLIFILRFPLVMQPFYNMDEGISAVLGNTILDGGLLYRDAIDQRGPALYYLYALVFAVAGRGNMVAVHLALIATVMLITLLVYAIAREAWGRRQGCIAALLFAVFSYTYFQLDILAFHQEWLVALFSCLGVWSMLVYFRRSLARFLFFAGIAFGMAFVSKQNSLLDFILAAAFSSFLISRRGGFSWVAGVKVTGWLSAGFLFAFLPWVAYFYLRGGISDFLFYFWEYNFSFYSAVIPLAERISIAVAVFFNGEFFRLNFLVYAGFLLGAVRAGYAAFRLKAPPDRAWYNELFLVLWGLAAYTAFSVTGRSFGHYFIQMLPALCLVSANSFYHLMRSTRTLVSTGEEKEGRLAVPVLRIFLTGVLVYGLLWPVSFWDKRTFQYVPLFYFWGEVTDQTPEEDRALGEYIRTRSTEQDKVFVWGFYPQMYIHSGRMPASRYTYCTFLTGMLMQANERLDEGTSRWIVPGSWDIFMAEMRRNAPLYIIDTSVNKNLTFQKYPPSLFPQLEKFLQEHYAVDSYWNDSDGILRYRLFRRIKSPA